MAFSIRPATPADVPQLEALIRRSALGLSHGFYTPEQAVAATQEVFGVDSQLVADQSYFAVEDDGVIVACGGWSQRSTPFGADRAKKEPDRLLDPATEAARIRAFFVDPGHARRGLGSLLMNHCMDAARAAGFSQLELTATLPGEPLYAAFGFEPVRRYELALAVPVPMVLMRRDL